MTDAIVTASKGMLVTSMNSTAYIRERPREFGTAWGNCSCRLEAAREARSVYYRVKGVTLQTLTLDLEWRRSRRLLPAMRRPGRRSSRPSAPSATPSRREPATSKVNRSPFPDLRIFFSVFLCVISLDLCVVFHLFL